MVKTRFRRNNKKGNKIGKIKVSKKSVSLAVKKYVKRSIHANVENKRALSEGSFSVGSIASSTTLNARPLTPASGFINIVQGIGQGDRIGNKCKTLKAMFRYTLNALPYDLTNNPLPTPSEVMIIFGYVKQTPTIVPTATNINNLFQNGNTSSAPQGDIGDLIQPINNDYWVIKKIVKHKIGTAAVEGTGSQANKQFFANNDYKFNVVRSLNITSMYPKSLVWNDVGTFIQNAGLFVMIQAVRADGTVSPATQTSVFFNYALDLTYEDA